MNSVTKTKFSDTDVRLQMLIVRRKLSKSAIKNYNAVFNELYDFFKLTPTNIVAIGKKEQRPFKDENGEIQYIELEDRSVTHIQFTYYKKLEEKKLTPRTIKLKLDTFRALLGEYNIEKPKPINVVIQKDRIRDEEIVSWREVEAALSFCNGIRDKAIIAFMATTGLRSSDVINLTINNLIEACDIFFDENEEKTIDVLLSKNPEDIIPCWEIMPSKTSKNSQLCVTFNTPEATMYIFQYLKERKRIYLKKDKESGGIIEPEEPLFATSTKNNLTSDAIGKMFQRINKKLGGHHDKNGKYGRFRAHSLRKLFTTTCRRNITQVVINSDKTSEIDIISIFTGHIPPNESNSRVYEAIESDSHDSYLRKTYMALVPYLSIQDIEIKDIKTQQYKDLEEQNKLLQEKLESQEVRTQRELDEKNQEISMLREQLTYQGEQIEQTSQTLNRITKEKTFNTILEAINDYIFYANIFIDNPKEEDLIVYLATDYAVEHKDEFEFTETYLDRLIRRIRTRISLDGRTIDKQYDDYIVTETESSKLQEVVALIAQKILNNPGIMDLIGEVDLMELEDIIESNLSSSNYDIEDLSSDDVDIIIEEVVMDCT